MDLVGISTKIISMATHGSRSNFNFQSYYFGNAACKAIADMDSDSSDESGQNKLKTSAKDLLQYNVKITFICSGKQTKIVRLTLV